MALRSLLFRDDPKLEAAAVSDSAHITPGATGPHVVKIQQALIQLDGASIAADGRYGPTTAAAVLSYKQKRGVINRSYQTQADNIVGKMTIASLDNEMANRINPAVVIGRASGPMSLFAPRLRSVKPATQSGIGSVGVSVSGSIRSLIRGNPYVPQGALASDGMPDSVPPAKPCSVLVTVDPSLEGTSQFIELTVINSSGDNGSATVFPSRITKSATVTVTGGSQTAPGHAGQLQIQAKLDGNIVNATSAGFSVCAHPLNMAATLGLDVNDETAVGIIVRVAIQSDSGRFGDLDQIAMSEVVEQFRKDQPPFNEGSGFANTSGFQSIIPPLGKQGKPQTQIDRHVEPRPAPGPNGKSNRIQLHIFNCQRCGAVNKVLPKSGFDILHEVFQVGKIFKHRVTKVGAPISIKVATNVFKATAGSATGCRSPEHDLK